MNTKIMGLGVALSRAEAKKVFGGVLGGDSYCGDRYKVSNCPVDTTPQKCDQHNSPYCKETLTGKCYYYGTAVCDVPA